MNLRTRFKRWLMDQYCRDEVVQFAREMVQKQVAETQKQLRENCELILLKHDQRERIRKMEIDKVRLLADIADLQDRLSITADELRSVRANYEGWRHEAKRLGARGLES